MNGVNIDYVLGVIQKNDRLEIVKEIITSSSPLLSELENIVKNDKLTIMDMQEYFNKMVKTDKKSFRYVLPFDYSHSFVYEINLPYISFEDYQKKEGDFVSDIKSEDLKTSKSKSLNQSLKKDFYQKYKRYLQCYYYDLSCNKIKENREWKMFSSESIGWTYFNYPIDKDFDISVSTNFGYGQSSYFYLTVKYQNIIIAPYSLLVKYYRANMVEICNCTRSYCSIRDNWEFAFDFVKDFVNYGKEDPTNFIKKYIMNEVEIMVKGLLKIMQSPESEIMLKIKDMDLRTTEYNSLRCIAHMTTEDKEYFEINPQEFGVVYKSEKISCGLDVLESLKTLLPILPEIEESIDMVKSMNHLLIPEIKTLSDSIELEIKKLKLEIENYANQIKKFEKEKEPYIAQYTQEWKVAHEKEPSRSQYAFEKEFVANHPKYHNLFLAIQDLIQQKKDVEGNLIKRSAIKDRLDRCLSKINDYFVKAA